MSVIRIEGEVPPRTLGRPRHIDHSWLFATSGLHRRLGVTEPNAEREGVSVEPIDALHAHIAVTGSPMWSNGMPVLNTHIASLLTRSRDVEHVELNLDGRGLIIKIKTHTENIDRILRHPAMVLTPEVHDFGSTVTSGPFRVVEIKGKMETIRFASNSTSSGVEKSVEVMHFQHPSAGLAKFAEGTLHVTRTLGADPNQIRGHPGHLLMSTDLVMSIANLDVPRDDIDAVELDLPLLAEATRSTYSPASERQRARVSVSGPIHYADYYPNREVARAVAHQLRQQLGVDLPVKAIPYNDYIAGFVPSRGSLLIITLPPETLQADRSETLLLRANSTALISPLLRRRDVVRRDATVDWDLLELTND